MNQRLDFTPWPSGSHGVPPSKRYTRRLGGIVVACYEGYSLQANRKTREGKQHPDRNAQFEYINRRVLACRRRGQPAVSVDTKKIVLR